MHCLLHYHSTAFNLYWRTLFGVYFCWTVFCYNRIFVYFCRTVLQENCIRAQTWIRQMKNAVYLKYTTNIHRICHTKNTYIFTAVSISQYLFTFEKALFWSICVCRHPSTCTAVCIHRARRLQSKYLPCDIKDIFRRMPRLYSGVCPELLFVRVHGRTPVNICIIHYSQYHAIQRQYSVM